MVRMIAPPPRVLTRVGRSALIPHGVYFSPLCGVVRARREEETVMVAASRERQRKVRTMVKVQVFDLAAETACTSGG
jgi:hypothetical protein